jgi:hypothetical protein
MIRHLRGRELQRPRPSKKLQRKPQQRKVRKLGCRQTLVLDTICYCAIIEAYEDFRHITEPLEKQQA